MGCVSMDALLGTRVGTFSGEAPAFTRGIQRDSALTKALAIQPFRPHVQNISTGQNLLRRATFAPVGHAPSRVIQPLAPPSPAKIEVFPADESPAGSPVSTVSGGAQLSTAPSSQASGASQQSTNLVKRCTSWVSTSTSQVTGIVFQFAIARPWGALQAGLSPLRPYVDLGRELVSTGAGDVKRLCIAPARERAIIAARASQLRVTVLLNPGLEQVRNLWTSLTTAPQSLQNRAEILAQTVLTNLLLGSLTEPAARSPIPRIAAPAPALPATPPLPLSTGTPAEALMGEAAELTPVTPPPQPPATDPPLALPKRSLLDSVRTAAARATNTAQSTSRALAVRGTQASGGLRALTGRATAFSISLLPHGRSLCRSVTSLAQAALGRFGAWAGTQVRRTAAGALTGGSAGSLPPAILPPPSLIITPPELPNRSPTEGLGAEAASGPFATACIETLPASPLPPPVDSSVTAFPPPPAEGTGRWRALQKGLVAFSVASAQLAKGLVAFSVASAQLARRSCIFVGTAVGTTAKVSLVGLTAWAGTQIRRRSAGALTRQPSADSHAPQALADPPSTEGPPLESLTELFATPGGIALPTPGPLQGSSDGTELSPPHVLPTREEAPQAPPTSSGIPATQGNRARRGASVSLPSPPAVGPKAESPPVTKPKEASMPPVAPPAPLPSPLPAAPAAGTVSSPVVRAPSTQVTLTGLNRGVTVPIVGSVVGAVMFPVRVLETFGFTIATLFYGIKNGLTRDAAKRVHHSYGERARQSAKGVAVAAISIIPVLGPLLARALLNRWVQPKAPLSR